MVLLDLASPASVLLGRFGVGPDDVGVEGGLERFASEADDLGTYAGVGKRHVAGVDQRPWWFRWDSAFTVWASVRSAPRVRWKPDREPHRLVRMSISSG